MEMRIAGNPAEGISPTASLRDRLSLTPSGLVNSEDVSHRVVGLIAVPVDQEEASDSRPGHLNRGLAPQRAKTHNYYLAGG